MTDESDGSKQRVSSCLLGAVSCVLSLGIFGCGSPDMGSQTAVDDCSRVSRWQASLSTPLASEGQYSVRVLLDGLDQGSCTVEMENGEWAVPARGTDGPCAYTVDIHAISSAAGGASGVTPSNFQLTGVSGLVGAASPPAHVHVTVSLAGEALVDDETELKRDCGRLLGTVG